MMKRLQLLNLRGTSGMTLMEMMVVIGILSVVLMAALQLFSDVYKTANTAEAGQDSVALFDELSRTLNNTEVCSLWFKGALMADGTPVVLGAKYLSGAVSGKVQLGQVLLKDPVEVIPGIKRARVQIEVRRRSAPDGSAGAALSSRSVAVLFKVDQTGRISECLGDGGIAESNCQSLGGVWDGNQRACNLCPALGMQRSETGRCLQLATAQCPQQRTFTSESTEGPSGRCSTRWKNDFMTDSAQFLNAFAAVDITELDEYRKAMAEFYEKAEGPNVDLTPSEQKQLGSAGRVSWVFSKEQGSKGAPCVAAVVLNVDCEKE